MIKIKWVILLIVGFIVASSCCVLCKLEPVTEIIIDTLYFSDTIKVDIPDEDYLDMLDSLETALVEVSISRTLIDSLLNLPLDDKIDSMLIHFESEYVSIVDPNDLLLNFRSDTLHKETIVAEAWSWIYRNELYLRLKNKASFDYMADSLKTIIYKSDMTIYSLKKDRIKLRDKMKDYRRLVFIFGGLLLIVFIVVIKRVIGK
ncbi:hypothetical protein LCGC14_1767470 [marine sediment metagenome]|uniref:Lipoprotein n=1 Tax=marine sediment metagenome TaxID=412755 RepID=A0A0F9GZ88_9ZZZZ